MHEIMEIRFNEHTKLTNLHNRKSITEKINKWIVQNNGCADQFEQ